MLWFFCVVWGFVCLCVWFLFCWGGCWVLLLFLVFFFYCKYDTLDSMRLWICVMMEEMPFSIHFSLFTDVLSQLQSVTLYKFRPLAIKNQLWFICIKTTCTCALLGHSTDFVCKRTVAKKY